jgi:hypothetical protein
LFLDKAYQVRQSIFFGMLLWNLLFEDVQLFFENC